MKVVLSGIYYPVAILRYFEAALKRTNHEVFTVGPYTGRWIPWNGGMFLDEKYAISPDISLGEQVRPAPIAYIENLLPWKPDLWLQIDAGYHFDGKPSHGYNVIVGTDPHVLDYTTARKLADKFYCMQTPYMKDGDEWLPYAYDPIWHAPRSLDSLPLKVDAALVGIPYENRVALIKVLREKGYSVTFVHGPAYDEARDLYHQARIGLNWSSLQDLTARVFEIMAMGLCPIINRVPDLKTIDFIDGVHYLGFDTLEEAVSKFEFALNNEMNGHAIWKYVVSEAREAVREHTWDARIKRILTDCPV